MLVWLYRCVQKDCFWGILEAKKRLKKVIFSAKKTPKQPFLRAETIISSCLSTLTNLRVVWVSLSGDLSVDGFLG